MNQMVNSGNATGALSAAEMDRLNAGEHRDPHRFLGAHPITGADGRQGAVIRCMHPEATAVRCIVGDRMYNMRRIAPGFWESRIPDLLPPYRYRLRFVFADGNEWETEDAYRFAPTLGEVDQHLFNEGTHLRLWEVMGSHIREMDGVSGVSFSVWAPNARGVSVVGDFCGWDGRRYPMRMLGASGIFEIFVPGVGDGALYKFEIRAHDGKLTLKTDPFARKMEQAPANAAIVCAPSAHEWGDAHWIRDRRVRDQRREPMLIYEVHPGSWARATEDGNRPLSYRELAAQLVSHAKSLGVTHIELMPVAEHPFTGSWGYQVTGFYAPTSRHGSPDDLRFFVDECHRAGIGVILDWVPAHFPRDEFALHRFDGTALFEHEDPRLGEHPDWGTSIFNLGRSEVSGFLAANALYWLREFHFDGLRVDAVASMLYLDYSRADGEWISNRYGGRENLESVAFLRRVNELVERECPGCITIAEESTAWPGVTNRVQDGGLGFTFKWNLGWMHDTLSYFQFDPIYRSFHHDQITFAMLYEYSERFIMPLSHDEVVHMKHSLLVKMPGDDWNRFANMRALLAYMYTRPGKKLIFMGTEIAPLREWNHDSSLDWHLLENPEHAAFLRYTRALGAVYRGAGSMWQRDHEPSGFSWVDVHDRENSVFSYTRHGDIETTLVVLNFTPVPRENYRIGAPMPGRYEVMLNSDDAEFGGSGAVRISDVYTESHPYHGRDQSMLISLPPMSALVLRHTGEAR